ncbi:DUF4129 domain-containing protein [Kitasatospora sp. NPDC101157]|uniref:DUF4129 domain-containing protein n=1 Tax=Kitasatospora sp. NPDC101157 TaxID=3364098 RepID=UPI0037F93B47
MLLVVGGLSTAAATLRPDGGLLGTAATGPVSGLGFVVLLGLAWASVVGRFAVRFREEVRHLDGPTPRAERLRAATMLLLPVAAVAVPVLLLVLNRRAASGPSGPRLVPGLGPGAAMPTPQAETRAPEVPGVVLGAGVLVAALFVLAAAVALLFAVVVLLRLRGRQRPVALPGVVAASPESALAEAVASGRRALEGTDARAAVIACYAAMEGSLAASGLPRHAWESPTELLRRVLSDERVDATAARELTALFREARYSTHRTDDDHVRRARTALDAIAARLADARPPATTGAHTEGGGR